MLSQAPIAATLPFRGLDKAEQFYGQRLGLERLSGSVEDGYLVYQAGQGTTLQLFESTSDKKSENTAATFEVSDLDREMETLRKKGITFEEYDLPGVKTVNGVAHMGPHAMAWMKDPDGNLISLNQR